MKHAVAIRERDQAVQQISAEAFAALAYQVMALQRRLDALERRGQSAPADLLLLQTIAGSTEGRYFRAGELLDHARRVDPDLAAALENAMIETVAEIGCWLRKTSGEHGAIVVRRLRGRRWQVLDTSTHPPADREG